MQSFEHLQDRLADVWRATRPDADTDHVVVVLPSHGLVGALLEFYAQRLPALEHRFLTALLELARVPRRELVFVCSEVPPAALVDSYAGLLPAAVRADVLARFRVLTVPGPRGRSLAQNLAARPDLLTTLRRSLAGRPALLEPWHVTAAEAAVAVALGTPVYGTPPALAGLGTKSGSRRLFRRLDVPTAPGREGVRSADEVAAAVAALRAEVPCPHAVVVKLDDGSSGIGNHTLHDAGPEAPLAPLPGWYLADLVRGGVVELRVEGALTSPSVQLDLTPDGPEVLSTHEQVLTGTSGQVYDGCRLPADQGYAAELARLGGVVGAELHRLGARGRAAVDFVARLDGTGGWELFALELNLRKGGTTPPYAALRALVPGRYHPGTGRYRPDAGGTRAYCSTDNLVDPAWRGLPPELVPQVLAAAGLTFDPGTGTGVLVHMLSALAVDGRFGMTAVGTDPAHASGLFTAAEERLRAGLGRVHPRAATARTASS